MNSSGIKRGLATTAVSALAIAGLPLFASSASAQPGAAFESNGATAVTLVQPWFTNTLNASTQNDGKDNTVRLTASAGADVTAVSFYYTINNAAPVLIGTATRNDNGFFAQEWAAAGLGGSTVEIFAIDGGSTPVQISGLSAAQGRAVTIDNNKASVEVTDGNTLGVFQAPYNVAGSPTDADAGPDTETDQYVIFSGTASAGTVAGDLTASWLSGTSTSGGQNIPVYKGTPSPLVTGSVVITTPETAAAADPESYAGVLDIDDYVYGGASDDLFVHVVNSTAMTDAGEAYTLYRQTITTVTATADKTNVPNGQTATVTVTVADQNGKPIAGARVARSDDTDDYKYTNALGQVTYSQGSGTRSYYADATDNEGFQDNLGDKKSADVTVTQFVAAPTAITGASENGNAFDLDEVDPDDFTVQVRDQAGNPFLGAGRTVRYYWVITPFDGVPATQRVPASPATKTAVTDGNGKAIVDFPTALEATDREGTYELFVSLDADIQGNGAIASAKALTVKAGQSVFDFDGSDPLTAPAGGSIAVSGTLELDDNTPLPGREVQLDYTGGNARFVLANGATTATVTAKTDANGAFSATLKDPAETPNQSTETGNIAGTTNAVNDKGGDADDPNATGDVDVQFFSASAPAGSTITIADIGGTGKPGVAQDGTATLRDASNNPVANTAVTLTVDGSSFFTDGTAKSTAKDALVGDLKSLGQSITLVTDNAGQVTFKVAVGRSTEFDDDGLAEDIVTATISTGSDTEDVDYSSAAPLNGGTVTVDFADEQFQESDILPKAPTTDDIYYDVNVTDQFGNEVSAVVNVDTDADGTAETPVTTDFTAGNVEFQTTSNVAKEITPKATWTAPKNVYAANNTPAAPATTPISDEGPTGQFYVVDFANSTYTLSQQGPESVPVGTTVIMEYTAIDQNGEPIEFSVNFFRTGPDEFGDGESKPNVATGEDGTATYVFQGAVAGTATVTAIGTLAGEAIPESQKSDLVQFQGAIEPADINVVLTGKDNKGRADILRVTTEPAAPDALATLYKVNKKGERTELRFKTLDAEGKVKFRVKDKNGKKGTRYVVEVDSTETTNSATSNSLSVE